MSVSMTPRPQWQHWTPGDSRDYRWGVADAAAGRLPVPRRSGRLDSCCDVWRQTPSAGSGSWASGVSARWRHRDVTADRRRVTNHAIGHRAQGQNWVSGVNMIIDLQYGWGSSWWYFGGDWGGLTILTMSSSWLVPHFCKSWNILTVIGCFSLKSGIKLFFCLMICSKNKHSSLTVFSPKLLMMSWLFPPFRLFCMKSVNK